MPAVRAVAADLRGIALAAGDATGYFPALYALVTERVAASIESGRFSDPEAMDRFACVFAGYYTSAVEGPDRRPRCWQACWDVGADPALLVVQHLLLGINAHVNHDLPLAAVATAAERDGGLGAIRRDFDAVNDVLAETYGDFMRSLDRVSRWTSTVAAAGGGRLFNFSLRLARDRAWDAAVRIDGLAGEEEREAYRAELDQLVSVLAYLVTRPPPLVRPLVWLARRFEQRDPAAVVATLLDGG